MGVIVPPNEENLDLAAELLAAGELVCFPTETVYGVGADATQSEAVEKIFRAKGRPSDHPLIVHLGDGSQLSHWTESVPESAVQLARAFWPGPLTLVLKKARHVPSAVTGGQETVALRVPDHPVAIALLTKFNGGVAAPSANRFGRVSPTRAQHVEEELGDGVALILDGGPCRVGVESTIVDLSEGEPRILRPGVITSERLAGVLGATRRTTSEPARPRVPGSLAGHYSPAVPVRMVTSAGLAQLGAADSARTAVLAFSARPRGYSGSWLEMPADALSYARALYDGLRRAEAQGAQILVEAPPQGPEWEAVNDRLLRASVGSAAGSGITATNGRRVGDES